MQLTNRNLIIAIVLLILALVGVSTVFIVVSNQTTTQQVTTETSSAGYTLFAPLSDTKAYLIDTNGNEVHSWQLSGTPALSVYLLEDGNLLATYAINSQHFTGQGIEGGGIEILDWDSNQLWSYQINDETYHQHHDVEYLPTGNILAIAFEKIDEQTALAAGVNSGYLVDSGEIWADMILEIDPNDNEIVWQWRAWDHLLPKGASASGNPQLIDPNHPTRRNSADWLHFNAVDYNSALDQIIISAHNTNEVWIIDHNTTSQEAAGSAGDLLYRWGNNAAYGDTATQYLYGQHDAHWIDPDSANSNIILFNNGNSRERDYSTVIELSVSQPYNHGQASIVWEYGDNENEEQFFSERVSGVQRLSNGNTLICSGVEGWIFEVDAEGNKVWEYKNTEYGGSTPNGEMNTGMFRATRYETDYQGLEGVILDQ